MKIIIFCLLLYSTSGFTKPTDLDKDPHEGKETIPEVNVPSINFQDNALASTKTIAETYFEKRIIHRPKVEVNQYLGDLITSFTIPLPKGFHSLSGLNFKYNSSQFYNYGYGIGISLDYPKMEIDGFNGELRILAGQNAGELTPRPDLSDLAGERVKKICTVLSLNCDLVQKDFYLNRIGEDSALYVRFKSNNLIKYAQIKEDGETWVFNESGMPERVIPLRQKGIRIYSESGVLSKIEDLDSEWLVNFNYLEDSSVTRSYNGQFRDLIKGLKNIEIAQSGKKLLYDFKYSDEYLVKVSEKNALKVIFAGQYRFPDGNSYNVKQEMTEIKSSEGAVIGYDSNLAQLKWHHTNAKEMIFYVDLNGDYYLDKIAVNQEEIINKANAILKNYRPVLNKRSRSYLPPKTLKEFTDELNSIKQEMTISIAVNENGSIVYKHDPALKIPANTIKFFNFSPEQKNYTEETEFGSWNITYYDAGIKLAMIPKFIDVDNNGKKDLLFCNYIDEKKNQLELGGNFKGKSQNSMVMSYFNFYARPASDNFLKGGNLVTAFLIYPDKARLNEAYLDRKNNKIGYVFNASKMNKVDFTNGIPCNQNTLPIDYNNDGVADLLTGNQVALMNESKETKVLNLSNDELKKIILPPRHDLKISEHPVELLNLKNDGTLEFVESIGNYVDYKGRELVYLKDNMAYKVKRKSPVKLLTREYVTFGGFVDVNYQYVAGSSLVESLQYNPKTTKSEASQKARTQPSYTKKYEYEGQKFHNELNIFLGHKSSKEILVQNQDTTIKMTEFDQDLQDGPLFYFWRARKNGRLLKQITFEGNGKALMSIENKYQDGLFVNGNRAFSYLSKTDKKILGHGQGLLSTQYEQSDPLRGLFFTKKIAKSITPASEHNNLTELDLNGDYYLLLKLNEKNTDKTGMKLSFDREYEYGEDGRLKRSRNGKKELIYDYDGYGRISRVQGENNKNALYEYYRNSPLVAKTSNGQHELNYKYDNVTNYISEFKKDQNSSYQYKWSTDEILLEVKKKNTMLYDMTPIYAENAYVITSGDIIRKYSLDGFGRVVEIERKTSDGPVVEKSVVLNSEGLSIREDLQSHSGMIQTKYDALGREVYQSLTGEFNNEGNPYGFKKISVYNDEGSVEITEDLSSKVQMKSTTFLNEKAEVTKVISPKENVSFSLNVMGQIKAVPEIGAIYKYDHYSTLASTEGLLPELRWAKMEQEYSPEIGEWKQVSGMIREDEFGQIILSKNNSETSTFVQRNIYEEGNLNKRDEYYNEVNSISSYEYDRENLLIKSHTHNLNKEFEYDALERIKNEKLVTAEGELELEYSFSDGVMSGLAPFIKKVFYDEEGLLSSVEFENGVYAEFQYDIFKKPIHLGYNLGNGTIQIDYNTDLGYGGQSKFYTNVEFLGLLKQKEKKFEYDKNLRLTKKTKWSLPMAGVFSTGSNLLKIPGLEFKHENDLISAIIDKDKGLYHNFVSPDKKWKGTCPEKFKSLDDCFIKKGVDEYISRGKYIRAIRVAGRILGVLYKNEFYPAITDHLGSVLALVSPDGKKLAFERVYSEWGEKEKVIGDKELEKNIPWAFAGLIQHPFLNGEILQSDTRIYIPALGIWSSADNLVKWSPNSLKGLPGNWNPILYASGDPVNNMDPSGHYSLSAADGAGFSMKFREELKVDSFNKWNSAEGRAYRTEAIKNLGKVSIVAVGGAATLVAGGPFLSAAGSAASKGLASLALAGSLEFNIARVTVGSWVARNPETVEKVISNGVSIVDREFFDGYGSPPSSGENYVDIVSAIKSVWDEIYGKN